MTTFFRRLHDFEEATSTSDLAREMLSLAECEVPLVVRARKQSAGRGRGENRWWSDEGSLTFTLAINPETEGLERHHEPRLALAVAAGILETLEARGLKEKVGIRWPNDLEALGKKLGGILPERIETDHGPRLLIGIGLNVTTRIEDAPSEIRAMATSLRLLGMTTHGTDEIFYALLADLPTIISRLAADDPQLASRWGEVDCLRGQRVWLKAGDRVHAGTGAGITADGGLILSTPNGQQVFYGGQVLR